MAAPVIVEVPGGPAFAAAALSSATSTVLDDADERTNSWRRVMEEFSEQWSQRLEALG